MLKRFFILLITLLLLGGAALAQENVYDLIEGALYRIVLRTENGDETLGTGLLYSDRQLLLTSASCVAEGEMYAIGVDGEHAISAATLVDASGVALLEMSAPSSATPLHLAEDNAAGMAALFGAAQDGTFIAAPLDQIRSTIFRGQEALLLSSSEGLLPGSFLTDETGGLIGLCIAQHAEGEGAYIALEANGLYRALSRQQYAEAFLPVEARWADGLLTLTWTDEARGSGVYIITLSGDDNPYYTFFEAGHDENSMELTVPPEHRYDFQVQWAEDAGSAIEPVWAAMKEAFVPGAAFRRFGYTQACDIVTRTDPRSDLTEVPQPTLETMTSRSLLRYLRVTASYDVEESIDLPMTIELVAPDGQFYFESAVHTFSPRKEKEDAFLLPLDGLLADCAEFSGGALMTGQYRLRYAIQGETAGEYTFLLLDKPAQEEQPVQEALQEGATAGFVTELAAHYANGAVRLSWPAEQVPQGATVTAYYMYENNLHYTYHQVEAGAAETEIYTVPGRQTFIWVTWAMDGFAPPEPVKQSDFLILPAAPETAFTLNGFENHRLSLTIADDPAAAEGDAFLPEVPLTRELLTDQEKALIFQTEDTYQVTEDSSGHPMMLALYTPEGLCFAYPLEYLFDVDLQTSDLWLFDLTSLCRDYESLICGAWPAGHYRLLYCIDGQVAGEYHFTLE